MRGQASAVYLFVITMVGLGIGPTAVALGTDFVFGDDNALRYSPHGSTVVVTASQEGQRLVLRITDSGPGLGETEQQRIFEPFCRAGRSDTGGLGLGLAICRGLVRAQGGSIAVDSTPGKGTTVSVTLPASPVPALVGSGR